MERGAKIGLTQLKMILRVLSVLLLCFVVAGFAIPSDASPSGVAEAARHQALEGDCGGDITALAACAAACAAGCACISTAAPFAVLKLESIPPVARLPELLSIRARAPDTAPPKHSLA